tara:strand:- start:8952 stop:9278 length:327 start_codon:yes stop_codon:yes gene_type:complete
MSDENFDEKGFWKKIGQYAAKAGREVIEKALTLYYVASDSDTPVWARGALFAALAYFISPLDAIPDVLVGIGFSDDLAVMAAALAAAVAYQKAEHVERARQQLSRWFA